MGMTRFLPWGVLGAVLLQTMSPGIVTWIQQSPELGDPNQSTLVTPAGYAYIVWAPICVGSLAFAIYQLLPGQRERDFYPRIRKPAIGVFLGFALWLAFAVAQQLWLTVVTFAGILALLWRILPPVLHARQRWTWQDMAFVAVPFALYTGWTSVAIFANLSAALEKTGLGNVAPVEVGIQALLLVLATGNGIYALRRTQGNLPILLVILWALGGIMARNAPFQTPQGQMIAIASAMAALILLLTTARLRLGRPPAPVS
jgi:hypothetical protein